MCLGGWRKENNRRKKERKETDRTGKWYLLSNYCEPSPLTCIILSHTANLCGRTFLSTDKMSLRKEWHLRGHIARKYTARNKIHILWPKVRDSKGHFSNTKYFLSSYFFWFLFTSIWPNLKNQASEGPGLGYRPCELPGAAGPGWPTMLSPQSWGVSRTQDFQCWNWDNSGQILIGELSGSAKEGSVTLGLIIPRRGGLDQTAKQQGARLEGQAWGFRKQPGEHSPSKMMFLNYAKNVFLDLKRILTAPQPSWWTSNSTSLSRAKRFFPLPHNHLHSIILKLIVCNSGFSPHPKLWHSLWCLYPTVLGNQHSEFCPSYQNLERLCNRSLNPLVWIKAKVSLLPGVFSSCCILHFQLWSDSLS